MPPFTQEKMNQKPVHSDAMSTDGYLIDQDYTQAYSYRGMSSAYNGCGWIASYNMLHALGSDMSYEQVHQEMDSLFPIKIPGPTPGYKLEKFLHRHVYFHVSSGREKILKAASRCRAGILFYWEGKEPHYTTFVRIGQSDEFRFFNVTDGLEDCRYTMKGFLSTRPSLPFMRAYTTVRGLKLEAQNENHPKNGMLPWDAALSASRIKPQAEAGSAS